MKVARKHELRGMKVARNLRAAIERTLREVQDANDAGLSRSALGHSWEWPSRLKFRCDVYKLRADNSFPK